MALRLTGGFPDQAIGPDQVRIAVSADPGEEPPRRTKVWRGGSLVGRLLDWTDYPPPTPAKKDKVLGYLMPATMGAGGGTYGIERLKDDGTFEEVEDAWKGRMAALEALLGEPIEGGSR